MPFIKKDPSGLLKAIEPNKTEMPIVPAPIKLSTADKLAHSATGSTKGRDFDAEARGKTRCALEEAWAQSPLLPMLLQVPSDRAALHALLDEIVTERMKRVFPNG